MRRKIPSSAALLAFEAAARHGNFAAAAELRVNRRAISRQIARLEALLDSKLFDRIGSRVRLNPAGARYARQVPRNPQAGWAGNPRRQAEGCPPMALISDRRYSPPSPAALAPIPSSGSSTAQHPHIVVNIAARSDPFILPKRI